MSCGVRVCVGYLRLEVPVQDTVLMAVRNAPEELVQKRLDGDGLEARVPAGVQVSVCVCVREGRF